MCLKTANRLEKYGLYAKTVSLQLKDTHFKQMTRSLTVSKPIQHMNELYPLVEGLFDDHWEGQPLRLIGVYTSNLVHTNKTTEPLNLFNYQSFVGEGKIRKTMEEIKNKYGADLIQKGIQKGKKNE